MKTICLNMIVKNEAAVLSRCLSSVKPLIDYWVIADTGSSDGTKECILQALAGVPGIFLERPWVDFSHNRNEALEASKGKGDYILFIDADEEFQLYSPLSKNDLEKDCYFIQAIGKSSEFLKTFLIRNDGSWHWRGVLHELIVSSKEESSREFFRLGLLIYGEELGYRSRNPNKYLNDALTLEEALLLEPDNSRYAFYLAQSYVHAREWEKALFWYEKRAKMEGDAEEVFWSLYCIACLYDDLKRPSSEVIAAYSKAYCYKPTQAEPLYRLSLHVKNRPFLAKLVKDYAKKIPIPESAARQQLWVYEELQKL